MKRYLHKVLCAIGLHDYFKAIDMPERNICECRKCGELFEPERERAKFITIVMLLIFTILAILSRF